MSSATPALLLDYSNSRSVLVSLAFDVASSTKESKNRSMRDRFREVKMEESIRFLSTMAIVSILTVKSR